MQLHEKLQKRVKAEQFMDKIARNYPCLSANPMMKYFDANWLKKLLGLWQD